MKRLAELFLLAASLAIGLLAVEAGYRVYLYARATLAPSYLVAVTDVPPTPYQFGAPGSVIGPMTPKRTITFKRFEADGELFQTVRIAINNLGWVSHRDYTRDKPAGEFRIAVVGDSLTASVNNETPWPDILEDHLNQDHALLNALGARHIRVLNLGVAGASMQQMAYQLAVIARRFNADMILFNFIEEDLARRHWKKFDVANLPPEPATAPTEPPLRNAPQPSVTIDGIEVPLLCVSPPFSVSNTKCLVGARWYAPPGTVVDAGKIRRVQMEIARERLWYRVILSPRPLALRRILGDSIIAGARASDASDTDDIAVGAAALRFAAKLAPRLLVTHNPLYHHLLGRSFLPKLDALQAALDADGIKIVRMERYMPIQQGQAEWFKWYNLPNDGHWSEAGAHVYAAAMAKAVHHYLLGADARDGKNGASPCESVFQAAESVLRKGAPPDAAETRALTDLVQSLRPRARMLYAGAETYAGCGFIPDLFARLGDGLFAQSHKEAAVNAWTASLDLAPARYALRRTLGQSLIAMGRYAQAESELGRLIDDGQDNADIRFMRGNARYRQQEFAAAVKDYSRGLELRPGNAGLLIQRAAARYELGAFADALGDADAAIAAGMDTPYARSVRTRIVEAEKKSGARPTPK